MSIGMDGNGQIKSRTTTIADVEPLQLPLSRSVHFRESNLEVATLVNAPEDFVGVLADDGGRVRGLWASFASDNGRELVQENRGMPSDLVAETLDIVRSQRDRCIRSRRSSRPRSLASARQLGLSDAWVRAHLAGQPVSARRAERRAAGRRLRRRARAAAGRYPARDRRQAGHAVSRSRARGGRSSSRCRRPSGASDGEKTLTVKTAALPGADIDRVVEWAGATLQAPHRAISAQRGIAPSGVYVAYFEFGSPASHYGLVPGRRIVEVDGTADAGSGRFSATGQRTARPLVVAHQDSGLEWGARSHHTEARSALLAGL